MNLIIPSISKHGMPVPAADIHPNSFAAKLEKQESLRDTMNDNIERVA